MVNGKLIGVVQVHVGSRVVALPVEVVPMERDEQGNVPGGFFHDDSGEYGILVSEGATPDEVREQIDAATRDAIRHISKKLLN